jgi:sec-independent protein translocase protein TatC
MLFNVFQKLISLRKKHEETRDEHGDVVKPFLDHMEDLRWTMIKCILVLGTAMVTAFCFRGELMGVLKFPLDIADPTGTISSTIRSDNIFDSFKISIKVALYVGLIASLPFLLYFIAQFVLPALTSKEKRALTVGFSLGSLFFVAGAAASYFYLVPHTLSFFWEDAHLMKVNPLWTWKSYISIFTWLTLGFGLMCEVPLVIILMASIGVVNYKFLASTRSYAITILFVLAAIVAPSPDPMTLLALALPIVAMYEGCIWLTWAMEGRRRKREKQRVVDDLVGRDDDDKR